MYLATSNTVLNMWHWRIKWWPNPLRMPPLNDKVERVQKTVLEEFYAVADLANPVLEFKSTQTGRRIAIGNESIERCVSLP